MRINICTLIYEHSYILFSIYSTVLFRSKGSNRQSQFFISFTATCFGLCLNSRCHGDKTPKELLNLTIILHCPRMRLRSHITSSCVLGTFVKWRKSTIGLIKSVCPSVRKEQLDSYWTDFHEISYLEIL